MAVNEFEIVFEKIVFELKFDLKLIKSFFPYILIFY